MENLTEIRQCLRRRRRKFSVGSPLVIEGVRALSHTCFRKVCIFYGALGLGVYGCICARSAPQDIGTRRLWYLQQRRPHALGHVDPIYRIPTFSMVRDDTPYRHIMAGDFYNGLLQFVPNLQFPGITFPKTMMLGETPQKQRAATIPIFDAQHLTVVAGQLTPCSR